MIPPFPFVLLLVALTSASCQKERRAKPPPETPPSETPTWVTPTPVVEMADVSIASASLLFDCPDKDNPGANKADQDGVSEGEREAPAMGANGEYLASPPCSQSSMQITITGQGDKYSRFSLYTIRLVGPKGEALGTLEARAATIWKSGGYTAWDQVIPPKTDVKASYKLSAPDWTLVEKVLGGSSFGPLYRLEADMSIDGFANIVRSAEIVREQSEMIDT